MPKEDSTPEIVNNLSIGKERSKLKTAEILKKRFLKNRSIISANLFDLAPEHISVSDLEDAPTKLAVYSSEKII